MERDRGWGEPAEREATLDVITIDGPAAAGKTTIARRISHDLGYRYLDTGAMYRALALRLRDLGFVTGAGGDPEELLRDIEMDVRFEAGGNRLIVDGVDYTPRLREPEAARLSSVTSTLLPVRRKLVELQRRLARAGGIVVEGRDMGTVVFPDARYKFFLTASLEERGVRRYKEHPEDDDEALDRTMAELRERDRRDSTRDHAPLRPAEDAVIIDSTDMSIEQVTAVILSHLPVRG